MSKARAGRSTPRKERRAFQRNFDKESKRLVKMSLDPQSIESAVERRGHQLLGVLAMSRHVARVKRNRHDVGLLSSHSWATIALMPHSDAALMSAGAQWTESPDVESAQNWLEILMCGVDAVANCYRLIRMGNIAGALVMARLMLERWTLNVAHYHRIERQPDESTKAFISRVWVVYPQIVAECDLGDAWAELSEALHGRGLFCRNAFDDFFLGDLEYGERSRDEHALDRVIFIVDSVLDAVFRQVRGGISTVFLEKGDQRTAEQMQKVLKAGICPQEVTRLFDWLLPLDFIITTSSVGAEILEDGRRYRATISRASTRDRLSNGGSLELAQLALLERRARAVERARKSFALEVRRLGEEFDPGNLAARLFRYIAISEWALIAASWTTGPEKDSLSVAAVALRSAWCLWLEDTDVSLPCARSVVEQAARARAWRIKPERARKVEDLGASAAPIRWLEVAGWKRLSAMAKALGEFSHLDHRVRRDGARDIIDNLQNDDAEWPQQTARGHVLDAAAYLLADEVASRLHVGSAVTATAFRRAVTLLDAEEHVAESERILNKSLALRGFDLGEPSFVRVQREGQGEVEDLPSV